MNSILLSDLWDEEAEILPDPDLVPEAYAEPWPPELDPDADDDGCCPRCNGEGTIVTCCDDICVGQGECMHGDGQEICPECLGGL